MKQKLKYLLPGEATCVILFFSRKAAVEKGDEFFVSFLSHTVWLVGSQFPNQGLNLSPQLKARSPSHWTTREFLVFLFVFIFGSIGSLLLYSGFL